MPIYENKLVNLIFGFIMTTVTYEELESSKTKDMIRERESFEVTGLSGRMGSAVSKIENIIENQSLSCRVYTYGRVASVVGIAAHNLATYNPDYEIAIHLVDNKLSVKYKK